MEDQSVASAGTPRKSKRIGLIVGGVVALLVLLAGAAFASGRLLNNQSTQAGGQGGPGSKRPISFQIERAKELPEAAPDVTGLFAERKDNSIFVTLGSGKFTVQPGKDGTVNIQTDGNGQKVEVVVTGETAVYKDVTQMPGPDALPGDGKVQQKVAPGSLDELSKNSIISVWGERRGDRVIATILLYKQPMVSREP